MRFRPKPFTDKVGFKCKFCIDCCRGRFIYLTLGDIRRIVEHGHDVQDFLVLTFEGGRSRFVLAYREWDLGCIFHDPETGKCRIHEYNPIICRIYPFMVSRRPLGVDGEKPFEYRGEKFWLYYDESCPGINAEEPETAVTPEEIAELGIEFEEELEVTDLDSFAELVKGGG